MSRVYEEMGDQVLEVMHEYSVNRNRYIEDLIRRSVQSLELSDPKVLEFGAGKGEFIDRFVDEYKTYALEVDPSYIELLGEKHTALEKLSDKDSMNFIYAIDVLEHIEDDLASMKEIYSSLAPGGKFLIYVPARMELYSGFDESIGHFRRYHKEELNDKLVETGFHVEECRYHELIGYFSAFANKLTYSKERGLNSTAVKIHDSFLFPVSNVIERFVPNLIGKSVYAVCRKPD